ncbi:MAG: M48 family metallopeptidase [Planctomycetota bacterium]|nr:M48 family metallopeptidase [Planctomycetota bacterium]
MRLNFQTHAKSGLLLSLLLLATCLPACTVNPATGKSQFNMVGQGQEIALGAQAEPEFLAQYGGEVPSPQVREYVSNLGLELAKHSERADLPWSFHVVNSPVINAFALPGGKVFVSRGLLVKMTNEAQLAGVLGHEIGHVTAQHIGQQMTRQMGISAVAAAIGVAAQQSNNQYMQVLGAGAQAGGGLYLLKFGRDQESQADELGMRYMSRLGYNPQAQLQVMEILKAESQGGGSQPEILSTHPLPDTRIQRLQAIIKTTYPDAGSSTAYHFEPENFKRQVLDPLSKLPPAPQPKPAAG